LLQRPDSLLLRRQSEPCDCFIRHTLFLVGTDAGLARHSYTATAALHITSRLPVTITFVTFVDLLVAQFACGTASYLFQFLKARRLKLAFFRLAPLTFNFVQFFPEPLNGYLRIGRDLLEDHLVENR
jgi:hypothetical protein